MYILCIYTLFFFLPRCNPCRVRVTSDATLLNNRLAVFCSLIKTLYRVITLVILLYYTILYYTILTHRPCPCLVPTATANSTLVETQLDRLPKILELSKPRGASREHPWGSVGIARLPAHDG